MSFCNTCRLRITKQKVLDIIPGPPAAISLGEIRLALNQPLSDILAALYDLEQDDCKITRQVINGEIAIPRKWSRRHAVN
jgi:hypothetical protein